MPTITIKTSTIFISAGEETHVYRSLEEVPEALRQQLKATTTGSNAATILIADRRGREELVRAIQGLPTSVPLRVTEQAQRKRESRERSERARARRYWLELILIAVLGLLLWSLAVWK